MTITKLKIDGMSCSGCVERNQHALETVHGVNRVRVDLASGTATVDHDGAKMEDLTTAIDKAGYGAKVEAESVGV
jgi:Cu+-exporting ATPase